jgi:hypothetical protein
MGNNLNIALKNRLTELLEYKKETNSWIVFTVGNTRVYDDSDYYLTPIRVTENLIIAGIVVFSENEGKDVFELIDGVVDYIFVDCEKKSKNSDLGLFNLERLAIEVVKSSKLNFYKGNDITVDSIDIFLFTYFKNKNTLIGGKNFLIIGIGNIGFKISLKLVERGANVYIKSRDKSKSKLISQVINLVKPKETISSVNVFEENNNLQFDAIILTHLKPLAENDIIFANLNPSVIVLDVGKGCLTNLQIDLLKKNEVNGYRLDVGDVFVNSIISTINYSLKFKLPSRRVLNNNLCIIEPGIIGLENEIVVNSIEHPSFIYGVCDGKGGFKNPVNKEKIFKNIKHEYNINNRL